MVDKNLKNLIIKRNRCRKAWKKNKGSENYAKFRLARQKVENARKDFYLNSFENCIGDSRQVYSFLNELEGANNSSSQVPFLIKDGKKVESMTSVKI